MKLNIRRLASLLLVLVCLLSLSVTAQAAELKGVKVKITLSGTLPRPSERYKVALTAQNQSDPMPAGSINGIYTMTFVGAGEQSIPTIAYPKVGVYSYTIRQIPGTNRKCTYDDAVYDLTVYVTNAPGGGLEVSTTLTCRGDEKKLDTAVFTNRYKVENPDVPQTNDESNFPLYIGMAAASILVLVGLYLTRGREESEE